MKTNYGFSYTSGQFGEANDAETDLIANAIADAVGKKFDEDVVAYRGSVPNNRIDINTGDSIWLDELPIIAEMKEWVEQNWVDIAGQAISV